MCVCGVRFTVDHAMICTRGGFIIQRHNELRDLEAELLKMVCYDVEVKPGLQPVTGEELNRGANQSHDARLDVHARGFRERQRSAYFDIRGVRMAQWLSAVPSTSATRVQLSAPRSYVD